MLPCVPLTIKTAAWGSRVVLHRFSSSSAAQRQGCKDDATVAPVLRFAPSPTGQLHLGGLRTALFNHLFARNKGGRWILRIEDTDKKRLVPGAVEAMQDILRWAGLEYDEGPDRPGSRGPYVQSERLELYKRYTDRLLASGHAYRDFRQLQSDAGQRPSSTDYLAPDKEEALSFVRRGKPYVVRLNRPAHTTTFDDAVYGTLRFPYDKGHEDPILVKSDGWPTYHLANVVDDAEMGITHVLRGEEWLPSMPIHLALYDALDIVPPRFVHLPLLINPDGSKLSKRHADVHVQSYRQSGYEPEAMLNFVALMGFNWHREALSDADSGTSEVFSMDEMIREFTLERIAQSRACPNLSKLQFLNRQHLSDKLRSDDKREEVADRLLALIKEKNSNAVWADRVSVGQRSLIADVILSRSQSLEEAAADATALFEDPMYDNAESAVFWKSLDVEASGAYPWFAYLKSTRNKTDALAYHIIAVALHVAKDALSDIRTDGTEDVQGAEQRLKEMFMSFEKEMKAARPEAPKKSRGRGAFLRPLRFALTGKPVCWAVWLPHPSSQTDELLSSQAGPTVAETIALLGKEVAIARITSAIEWSSGQKGAGQVV